ncbi:hypothetical protein, partial [Faecalibaculum rodentium]|uniref:hypothetical protein n=1 Tax=Faecalibaculum rodentium TaxID=1702221 RepID=UPI002729D4A5
MKGKTDRKTKTDPQSASLKKPEYSSLEETLEPALDELCMMDDVYQKVGDCLTTTAPYQTGRA